ncbi:MAG: hypothetical protein RUMPE_00839 [Eubacteriales bacterium SKADARSKE-1]|nr:hypothetical protein [Eubacteriales bacterium SKADARSKE-1]
MKKTLSFIFVILIAFTMQPSQRVFADGEDVWQDSEIRSIYISEGVSFEGAFNIGQEAKTVLPNGESEYTKKANIKGEFIKNPGNEIILSENLDVTFKYNNVEAWIEDPKVDIVKSNHSVSGPKWKVTSNDEVYVSPGQCIVSEQLALSRKARWFNIRKSWDNVGNFHADVVCSANGEIKFNTESLGRSISGNFILKNVSDEERFLQDVMSRKTSIVDEVCALNPEDQNDKDKYNYVTRRIEITYLDPMKNHIATALIQVNFRYNTKTKEVECISTSHKEGSVSNKNSIEVYLRTGDKTRNYGGAYGEIKVNYNNIDIEEGFTASCNYNGNITNQITTK